MVSHLPRCEARLPATLYIALTMSSSNHDPIEEEKVQRDQEQTERVLERTAPENTSSPKSSESTLHSVDSPDAEQPLAKFDFKFIPIPKHLQYFASRPPTFTLALNVLFAVGSTFGMSTILYIACANSAHTSCREPVLFATSPQYVPRASFDECMLTLRALSSSIVKVI